MVAMMTLTSSMIAKIISSKKHKRKKGFYNVSIYMLFFIFFYVAYL